MTRREMIYNRWIYDLNPIILGHSTLRAKFFGTTSPDALSVGIYGPTLERRLTGPFPEGTTYLGELERLIATLWVTLRYGPVPEGANASFVFDQAVPQGHGWGLLVWRAVILSTFEEGVRCLTVIDAEDDFPVYCAAKAG